VRIVLITIFPQVVELASFGILRIAQEKNILSISAIDPRDFTRDPHRTVDDTPFGGGAGMVMKPEPLLKAMEKARREMPRTPVFLLSPKGRPFTQRTAEEWSRLDGFTLVCGRYEGIDSRVENHVDGLVSLGDFVLSGGELAAMVMVDAVCRLIPQVVGREESLQEESFSDGLLEYPHYTRPAKLGDEEVPPVLLSGNHAEISRWRREQQLRVTWQRRPDLLKTAPLGGEDVKVLTKVVQEP